MLPDLHRVCEKPGRLRPPSFFTVIKYMKVKWDEAPGNPMYKENSLFLAFLTESPDLIHWKTTGLGFRQELSLLTLIFCASSRLTGFLSKVDRRSIKVDRCSIKFDRWPIKIDRRFIKVYRSSIKTQELHQCLQEIDQDRQELHYPCLQELYQDRQELH